MLAAAGVSSWEQLAGLSDARLRQLAAQGASEQRLTMLRGQAELVRVVGLQPQEAALLLHAGIASPAGLAAADPQRLLVQVGRLQRVLLGPVAPAIGMAAVQGWIVQARRATN